MNWLLVNKNLPHLILSKQYITSKIYGINYDMSKLLGRLLFPTDLIGIERLQSIEAENLGPWISFRQERVCKGVLRVLL